MRPLLALLLALLSVLAWGQSDTFARAPLEAAPYLLENHTAGALWHRDTGPLVLDGAGHVLAQSAGQYHYWLDAPLPTAPYTVSLTEAQASGSDTAGPCVTAPDESSYVVLRIVTNRLQFLTISSGRIVQGVISWAVVPSGTVVLSLDVRADGTLHGRVGDGSAVSIDLTPPAGLLASTWRPGIHGDREYVVATQPTLLGPFAVTTPGGLSLGTYPVDPGTAPNSTQNGGWLIHWQVYAVTAYGSSDAQRLSLATAATRPNLSLWRDSWTAQANAPTGAILSTPGLLQGVLSAHPGLTIDPQQYGYVREAGGSSNGSVGDPSQPGVTYYVVDRVAYPCDTLSTAQSYSAAFYRVTALTFGQYAQLLSPSVTLGVDTSGLTFTGLPWGYLGSVAQPLTRVVSLVPPTVGDVDRAVTP